MKLRSLVELSNAPEETAFERGLLNLAADFEFDLVGAAMITEVAGSEPTIVRLGNAPEAFLAASTDPHASARDPVMRMCKRLSVPFFYDQETYVAAGAGDLWEEQAVFGYRTGVGVTLHLEGNRHFILGFDRPKALPEGEDERVRLLADLQLAAVYAQSAASRLFGRPFPVRLTDAEKQVLALTIQGHNAREISKAIHKTESTVNFHLQNARKKFGVTTKHLAALRAKEAGLL